MLKGYRRREAAQHGMASSVFVFVRVPKIPCLPMLPDTLGQPGGNLGPTCVDQITRCCGGCPWATSAQVRSGPSSGLTSSVPLPCQYECKDQYHTITVSRQCFHGTSTVGCRGPLELQSSAHAVQVLCMHIIGVSCAATTRIQHQRLPNREPVSLHVQ